MQKTHILTKLQQFLISICQFCVDRQKDRQTHGRHLRQYLLRSARLALLRTGKNKPYHNLLVFGFALFIFLFPR